MSRSEMQPGVLPAQIRHFRKAGSMPRRVVASTAPDMGRYEDLFRDGSPLRRRHEA